MSSPELIVPSGGDWVPGNMNYPAFRDAGHSFALRYCVPEISGKMISHGEIIAAHAAGIDVGFVYETTGETWRGGKPQGEQDAVAARTALDALGAPQSVACYHAVDSQVADSELPTVIQWLSAISDTMRPYRTGVYGQYSVIESAREHVPSAYRWQTQAWSDGHVSARCDLLQLGQQNVAGIAIDVDLAYITDFGQWYANPAKQPRPPTENDMISGTIPPMATIGYPIPPASPTYVMLFCDVGLFGGVAQKVRVAIRSKAKGWSQIITEALSTADSVTIPFEEHDVDAVSFSRNVSDGQAPVGFAIV